MRSVVVESVDSTVVKVAKLGGSFHVAQVGCPLVTLKSLEQALLDLDTLLIEVSHKKMRIRNYITVIETDPQPMDTLKQELVCLHLRSRVS